MWSLPHERRFKLIRRPAEAELSDDIHRYRDLAAQRKELDRTLGDLGTRTVKRLRSVVDLTDEDSAAVLGISRQRANQLRNA